MKRLSIGLRLTLWYVAIFALAQVVFATGIWFSLAHHLEAIVDDNLQDEVQDLQTFVQEQGSAAGRMPALAGQLAKTYTDPNEYLEVADENGTVIFQSSSLREYPVKFGAPPEHGVRFENLKLNKKHVRFMTCWLSVPEGQLLVHFGLPTRQAREALEAFQNYLWMIGPIFIIVAAGGGYWLSRRALAPVDQLTRTARTISGASLSSRLEKLHTGDELQRLSDTLNEMLDRIENAFQRTTEFTADASHELRTPVSLIRTEAELALRRSRDPQDYRAALEHILAEAERTTHLLEHLLALARTDSGRESLEILPIDLRTLLQQTTEAWASVFQAHGVEFLSEIAPENVPARGDAAALRRVLDILLDNALKYSAANGRVRVSLLRQQDQAIIRVEDNGIGIPSEQQQRIFERFYRVDKARSRSLGGAGLGLAIARWIVLQHGGMIHVQSHPGTGSTFEVRLPVREPVVGMNRSTAEVTS